MRIHSRLFTGKFSGMLISLLLLFSITVYGQNNAIQISVVVAPPYSTKISDYTSNPGKIIATVRNISPTGGTASIYLSGSITGESGISVTSAPGYKPIQPIVIAPGASKVLTINNIGDVFDEDHLNYEGITENEVIMGNGLPEDYYTICLRAWDYNTDEPLSDEDPSGCSTPFHITDIEPPMITQPFCGDNISLINPQNIIISWTYPAGAPVNTEYKITMVEVQPSDHSPEDAMNSARRPAFYQSPVPINGTSFIYGPAQPVLVEGKTYAFRVTAKDPTGATRFRNNGQSEVCSFTWKKETIGGEGFERTKPETISWGKENIQPPPLVLPTTIKGRLQYEYMSPEDDKKYPLGGVNIKLVIGQARGRNNDISKCNPLRLIIPPMAQSTDTEYGTILATAKTNADGTFSFTYYDNTDYLQLATAHPEAGDAVFRVALISVEAPQSNYFFNPEIYIIPEKGKMNDLGNVTTLVRSYSLEVTAKPTESVLEFENNAVESKVLGQINVYLCRKIDFSYQVFPLEDGKCGKNKIDETIRSKFKNYGLKVVAMGTTNINGIINFQKLVWNQNSEFQYYLMSECNPEADLNFVSGAPIPVVIPNEIILSSMGGGYIQTGENSINPATMPYSNLFELHQEKRVLSMKPEYPRIAGTVKSSENADPIQGVKVDLNETYNFDTNESVWAMFPYFKIPENAALTQCVMQKCGNYYNGEYIITGTDGRFEFKDLSMLYSIRDKKVDSPERKLILSKDGYKTDEVDIGVLSFGKQKVMNGLRLEKGATLKGYVRDGDSKQVLDAFVRLPGGSAYQCNAATGYYSLPVLLLPGKTQQIIVEKEGYISDTLTFTADKKINSLDVDLFTAKRRLKVIVFERGNMSKRINMAFVNILNVNVNQNGHLSPLGVVTFDDGIADISFENNGDNPNQLYKIRVGMMSNSLKNYEAKYYSIKIPVSKDPVIIFCPLSPAACLKGTVYAGKGTESPVPIAKVQYFGNDTLTAISNGAGTYTLHNFPVRRNRQIVTALKAQSQYIGDEKTITVSSPSDVCIPVDFNLTVYNDMDITHLMGFPMEVVKLVEEENGTIRIKGNLTQLPSNEQFSLSQSTLVPFNNLLIKPGTIKNASGIPIAEPVTVPFKTSINALSNLLVMNSFKASMITTDGIQIDRQQGSAFGTIKSRIVVPCSEFNCNNVSLPELYLAANSGTNITKLWLTVFNADKTVKKPVIVPVTGFWICDSKGEALKYSFPKFTNAASTDLAKSFLNNDKVTLFTTLHTNCNNVTPADLNIKLGNVEITKTTMTPKPTEPIKFSMGLWKLESNEWHLGTNGITLKKAAIKGQLDISVNNLEISYQSITSDKTVADFSGVKLLGTLPVNVTASKKGLSYVNIGGNDYAWKVFAINPDNTAAASISGLEGLVGQDLPIAFMEMLSNGTPMSFYILDKKLKVHSLVDFLPLKGTVISVFDKAVPPYFMVQGTYEPGLPYISQFMGNMAWEKVNDKFKFSVNNPANINFTHHNMLFEWNISSIDIKPNLFTAKGTANEEGKIGPVDIVLQHKNESSEIDIPSTAKIYITKDKTKYFNELIGGMEVDRNINEWGNFWFEGVMVGMNGISNNPTSSRLKFICQGEVKATGQSINVNKLDAFPGMELTYEIATSSLHGSLDINKNLMGMKASGTANCVFDPHGWYLNILGDLDIPGIGGCGLFGLFGEYNSVPSSISTNFGSLRCIPPEFQSKVTGFLLQGRLTKQLIPPIEWGVTLPKIDVFVGVSLNADLTLNARTWMSFDPAVNTYGISLLAEGNISGGISGGIYNLYTSANAQLGISGVYYSNGNYSVTGCGSVKAGVSANVWLPEPIGWTGVSLTSPDVGLKMRISNTGTDFNLLLGSCGDNLCPEPSL